MIDLKFLKAVFEIALDAGDAIMNIYNNEHLQNFFVDNVLN